MADKVNPYIEALKNLKLPPRKPQEEELDDERLNALAHEVTEAMQKLKERNATKRA